MFLNLGVLGASVVIVSGCSLPIRSKDMPAMIDKLSQSNASACVVTGVTGGGGALPISPVPVPGGGWGKAEFTFCRSNEPGSEIKVTDAGIEIKHGLGAEKIKAIEEQLEALQKALIALVVKLYAGSADDLKPRMGF